MYFSIFVLAAISVAELAFGLSRSNLDGLVVFSSVEVFVV